MLHLKCLYKHDKVAYRHYVADLEDFFMMDYLDCESYNNMATFKPSYIRKLILNYLKKQRLNGPTTAWKANKKRVVINTRLFVVY